MNNSYKLRTKYSKGKIYPESLKRQQKQADFRKESKLGRRDQQRVRSPFCCNSRVGHSHSVTQVSWRNTRTPAIFLVWGIGDRIQGGYSEKCGKWRGKPRKENARVGEPQILCINSAQICSWPLNYTGVKQTANHPAKGKKSWTEILAATYHRQDRVLCDLSLSKLLSAIKYIKTL